MNMTNPLKGYGAGIRKETLLGWVAWYGISEPQVEYDALKQKVEDLGLDVEALPAPLRPGDSFKRACRYAEKAKIPIPGSANYANVLIRKVAQDNESIERHMIVETVDPEGKHLTFEEAARLIFSKFEYRVEWTEDKNDKERPFNTFARRNDANLFRDELINDSNLPVEEDLNIKISTQPNATLDTDRTPWSKRKPYKTIVDEAILMFELEYAAAQKFLDAQTIRQMVRRQMDIMRAFLLRRNGSVYFIPRDHEEKATAMCELLEWIGNGSGFHILPLIDTDKQREMIQAAFEDEVHESAQQMLTDLQEAILSGTALTSGKWVDYLEKKEKLQERALEYSDLIDREFVKAGTELALLDDAMTSIVKKGLIKESRGKKK